MIPPTPCHARSIVNAAADAPPTQRICISSIEEEKEVESTKGGQKETEDFLQLCMIRPSDFPGPWSDG